ncbi:MAG: hypothetical protein ACR2GY_07290 [Phycisphaerales bacterium]
MLRDLDRRWVFLLMFLAVMVPLLLSVSFPEEPTPMVREVFKTIENLPSGSRVLMAYDYDPGSKGELDPMAAAFTRHCAEKGHRMYFITLWPFGGPMLDKSIALIEAEYPNARLHYDYVSFGYKAGNEGPIKQLAVNIADLASTDTRGAGLSTIPMLDGVKSIADMDLVISVSAGDPGTKQWVQYATTPLGKPLVAGVTGVQAPDLYPYIPKQLIGLLGAIKGAAEYEHVLIEAYPNLASNPKARDGLRRMGPQLVAHILIVVLIILANIIYFVGRRRGEFK